MLYSINMRNFTSTEHNDRINRGTPNQSKHYYIYKLWSSIKYRCNNPNYKLYKDYGGRGIQMYKPWNDDYVLFKDYILSKIGEKPSLKHSLDRIDNNKGYEPDNLRWSDRSTQNLNQRIRCTNTTGYTGVEKTYNNKYKANITKNRKRTHLGTFDTLEEAVQARANAEAAREGTVAVNAEMFM